MPLAAISIGSNIGDSRQQVRVAFEELNALPQTRLVAHSNLYETEPVDVVTQPWFVNAAAIIETDLTPEQLLQAMLDIEAKAGRIRTVDSIKGPRPLDLDLLLFEDRVIDTERLCLPHPRMMQRRFVLEPLHEVAADWVHPVCGKSISALFIDCTDPATVRRIE